MQRWRGFEIRNGDSNSDGRSDILNRDLRNGATRIRLVDGVTILSRRSVTELPQDPATVLVTVADCNSDGRADVLLQRPDTGRLLVQYLMERGRLPDSGFVEITNPKGLGVADVGDFNGDGVDEVLFSDVDDRWHSMGLAVPRAPTQTPLGSWPVRDYRLACEKPDYYQFGSSPKPASADAMSAFLGWRRPDTRENGEALCRHELAGYRVYSYTTLPRSFSATTISDPDASHWLFDSLSPNTHYFLMMSVDAYGAFSRASALVSKTIP